MTTPQRESSIGVDIGGTFTDVLHRGSNGETKVEKRLSTPADYSKAIIDALRSMSDSGDLAHVAVLAHATTIATNAVLEETGGRVGLITTEGFRDVLEFGRLQRSALYDLTWDKPRPLVPRRRRQEVIERVASDGSVLTPLDDESVDAAIDRLLEQGVDAIAVCLINSYANPGNERRVADAARARAPHVPVVASVALLREVGEFERTSTAVVNAYLLPVVGSYLRTLSERLRSHGCETAPSIMQSSGGMISLDSAAQMPVRMIESGPAAGVTAAAAFAEQLGIRKAIGFDMGGTTAKACLIEDFRPSISDEYWVGSGMNREGSRLLRGSGHPIRVPTMDIAEVSAGGGSIAWIDEGGALKVGPRSAAASPGPACYGLGGTEPTFTDACAVLGILGRETIGAGGLALQRGLAEEAIRTRIAEPLGQTVEDAARGIYDVAVSNLMRAVRAVTTDVGKRPQDFTLIAFGGGGGMVAAPLARELGIAHVIVPPLTGVFSAVGLLTAPYRRDAVQAVFQALSPASVGAAAETAQALEEQLRFELRAEGHRDPDAVTRQRRVDMRYRGQSTSISVEWPEVDWADRERALETLRSAFREAYERLHRHLRDDADLEVAAVRVTVEVAAPGLRFEDLQRRPDHDARLPAGWRPLLDLDGGAVQAAVVTSRFAVEHVDAAADVIVDEADCTIYIPRWFSAELDAYGGIHLRPRSGVQIPLAPSAPDASSIEIFNNWMGSVNDEMTALISRTAQSEIAKDMLDFATAICDREGRVVSQGLTMALHAGSIPAAIELLLARHGGDLRPGDVFVSNDPYLAGGSHLPDLYVIRPLFAGGELIAFAGTVCHVADMGGRVPGGNAADSHEVYQEGLRLPFVRVVRGGAPAADVEAILRANVRVPDMVLGDLHALIGACAVAERHVADLVSARGAHYLGAHMAALLAHAHRLFAQRLSTFPPGRFEFADVLDDDGLGNGPITIRAAIEHRDGRLRIDFAGTDRQVDGAINSPLSFTRSASYYVAKAVLGADIPDNSGYFELVDVRAPEATLVNPREPAATGAKGVTAFRITDTLFGAFAKALPDSVPAAGDGGASIIAFGGRDRRGPFVLVDLVMSAWGGRPTKDGIDGIASAAANGRNTPIEVVEASYPVRIEAYELIADSGGAGAFRGGLATHRSYRYLGGERATLQVRADRNPTAPWGLLGGGPGAVSHSALGGQDVATKFTEPIEPGAVFEHRTASGAGHGDPFRRLPEAVLEDVLDEKVTRAQAASNYGVVIADDLTVDVTATAHLRTERPLARPVASPE